MFKFIKNKFLFIILISIATLTVLVIGALTLYEDTSSVFASDGYILETTTKTNKKYYFSANTKYKENVDDQITFSDNDSNTVAVDPASFVHYLNGNVSFLQKGALVNLADITSPMVSYYNITNDNTIVKDNNQYIVTSNDKKIDIESFIGRISDSKYLIAGANVSIKIPKVEERIPGEYFEILYIEEGIIKIDNQEASYQVTAQDSYVYVGDNITINLGDGKIFYDGDAKMLLSQITINGDENIDLDVDENKSTGGGSGDGSGDGSGEGAAGEGIGAEDGESDGIGEGEGEGMGLGEGGGGAGDGTGDGTGEGEGEGDKTGSVGGSGTGGDGTGTKVTDSPQIELIEAIVTSTKIDLSLQLNNANLAKGNIVAYLTNVATGAREYAKNIDLVNGTFKITKESLSPSTEYALTIVETGTANESQYFQKTFRTKDLGITLEKVYTTENSLAYRIIFDENTEVTKANISIYDNNGSPVMSSTNEFAISKDDLNDTVTFEGLKSNTSYSVVVDTVWINNAAYSNVYTINRIDTTLKKTPRISGVSVDSDSEEVKFTINLENVRDEDKSIISYTYNIYLANDITLENTNPEIKYSITKNDSDALVLNLNEIDELKTGVDYRCKIVAQYNDNEMIREVSTDYSGNFLIKSKPNITFELKNAGMSDIEGIITLVDANCTVPISGRSCSNRTNKFTLRYYKLEEEEATGNNKEITFNPSSLTSELKLSDLASNTTYAVKVFGNYYDDENTLHPNIQIGDTFYVTTDKSPNIYFEVSGDNTSGDPNPADVVTFNARLTAPQNSNIDDLIADEISHITFNLYSGRYNTPNKLIGTYKVTEKSTLGDLFNNVTIKNSLFDDVTNNNVGKIDSLTDLIKLTNNATNANATNTLNSAYTVEVLGEYNSSEKIVIENNVYTFNLTPSYYLDARIATNAGEYVTITPILNEHLGNLTEEEYDSLSKKVENLDKLNKDTVVGITLENSLSDAFVNSAFIYEKAKVNYIICNETTKDCDNLIEKLTASLVTKDGEVNEETQKAYEEALKEVKILSVDMGNRYEPKEQTIYLNYDGDKYFTRGYEYKIGYYISFTTEDGSNPNYTNKVFYKNVPIERQDPIYTQYISTSSSTGITYRYSFNDVDNAIADKNFYYTTGITPPGENPVYSSVANRLVANGEYNEVTIPLNENDVYSLYYSRKTTKNTTEYIEISTYDFEKEYIYDDADAYTILNNSSNNVNENILKIKLENNDITNRAAVYKVVINTKDNSNIKEYVRYFLASKLNTATIDTGRIDGEGNAITEEYKYIAIDYANISRFMGHEMEIEVSSYYDSGLVGLDQNFELGQDQKFEQGAIFKNRDTGKYLNIYNGGSEDRSSASESDINMGMYILKEPYSIGDETIYFYNNLMIKNDKDYSNLLGASYYDTTDLKPNIGVKFNLSFSNAGITLNDGKNNYTGYNARVLKEATLKSNDNTYQFNTIIPTIKVTTGLENTINSINIKFEADGIYGNKQFKKDGNSHNKIEVVFYSDEQATKELAKIEKDVTITEDENGGYDATIADVEYKNLKPATKYYFKVFAYIDNEYTQLYDGGSTTNQNGYAKKTYESSTLDGNRILNQVNFSVVPQKYNGESSEKKLTWRLALRNTKNYGIRFELSKPTTTTTITDPETGEEIIIQNYETVKFDGSNPAENECQANTYGSSSNNYIENCYISIPQDEVANIHNKYYNYTFTGDDFIFGGNYYKLVVYAIPYTNNQYQEDEAIVIYQHDSLPTTNNRDTDSNNNVTLNTNMPFLEEATAKVNDLSSGYYCEERDSKGECIGDSYYYVSFKPTVTDNYFTVKNGKYTITLTDEKGEPLEGKNGNGKCRYFLNHQANATNEEVYTKENCTITMEVLDKNQEIRFVDLSANKPYYIEINYSVYRNNVGFTQIQKTAVTPFVDFTYTPIDEGITLGTITASQATTNTVTLIYNGGKNLNEIKGIEYTILLVGGSNQVSGSYRITADKTNIFTVEGDKAPRIVINTSDGSSNNPNFTFKSGNTYLIKTSYVYKYDEKGEPVQYLIDQTTGSPIQNTFLNL